MVDHDPGLQPLIDQAIDELARRLGRDRSAISVGSASLVTWSDRGFLGDRGMRQTQVPIDGSEIVLLCDGERYRYRTGGHVYVPVLYTD